jgi:AraC family transcriptional regulator
VFLCGEVSKTGLFYYLAGLPVSSLEEVPIELVGKTPPASEYAVLTHKGSLVGKTNTVKDTCYYAYGTWLPKSPYLNPHAYDFEYYDERFKGNDKPESEIDICMSIRER